MIGAKKQAEPERSWDELRRRVEAAGRMAAAGSDLSPEQAQVVLEERARALARPAAAEPDGEVMHLITFALEKETYAFESRFVIEVFRPAEIAPLPGAEAPLLGLAEWRGELLAVFDLRPLMGLAAPAGGAPGRVIVVGAGGPVAGILADSVQDLVALPAEQLHAPPEGVTAGRDIVKGISEAAVLVLDAEALLHLHA